jgi:tRNA (uracil-5-)-methyltransferase TRM9
VTDNVRDVFNQIAPSWYNFRHHTIFRRELEELAGEWRSGRLLNLGCGHGPDFLPFTKSFKLHGIDSAQEMVKLARQHAAKFAFQVNLAVADVCYLPYESESFDHAISVATYHHLKKEQRIVAFQELRRVLKPGGTAFVTVWNRWQPRFWFRGHDVMVPWRTKEKTLYRYYHLFSYGEFVKLARSADLEVVRAFPESRYNLPVKAFSRNICLLLRKGN